MQKTAVETGHAKYFKMTNNRLEPTHSKNYSVYRGQPYWPRFVLSYKPQKTHTPCMVMWKNGIGMVFVCVCVREGQRTCMTKAVVSAVLSVG